jgi:hypothetical protein
VNAYVFEGVSYRIHVLVGAAPGPTGGERVGVDDLRFVLDDPANAASRARLMREIAPSLPGRPRGALDVAEQWRVDERALERAALFFAIYRVARRRVIMHLESSIPVLGPAEDAEQQRVDFYFELPDGTAVSGIDYVLVDDTRKKTPGTLGKDGAVGRADAQGNYSVSLKEIDELEWE